MTTALCNKLEVIMQASPSRILDVKGNLTKQASSQILSTLSTLEQTSDPIVCDIDCPGGLFEEGLEIYKRLRSSKNLIIGKVSHMGISAGFMILQGCTIRYAFPQAIFQIHAPKAATWDLPIEFDTEEEEYLEAQRRAIRKFKPLLIEGRLETIRILRERSNILTEQDVVDLLKRDKVFGSIEAQNMGFIDEIL